MVAGPREDGDRVSSIRQAALELKIPTYRPMRRPDAAEPQPITREDEAPQDLSLGSGGVAGCDALRSVLARNIADKVSQELRHLFKVLSYILYRTTYCIVRDLEY